MSINTVVVHGRLTREPELRHTPSGFAICNVGLAHNERRKQGDEYVDVPHFFDVKILGNFGELCARKLQKGSPATVQGRLEYSSWEAQDGTKRSKVEIVASQLVCDDLYRKAEDTTPVAAQPEIAADDDIPF